MVTWLCSAATRRRDREDCQRPQEKTKEVEVTFAVSLPLVATKLFHGLDWMAQHAMHGFKIDTCTARGKVPMWKERGAMIERLLKPSVS